MSRRVRASLLAPLVLFLASCAKDAPLDSLDPAGPRAKSIDDLQNPVFAIAGVVFLAVNLGVLFLAWKFKRRKDDHTLPHQTHGNTKLELGWTILPALLLAGIGGASVLTLLDLEEKPDDSMQVTVVGQQWWWEYQYDVDGDGETDITTANDLVIPAGRNIDLDIESRDVIHSFWIPRLNGKRDAVPGRSHPLQMSADEPGVYRGQCTEFCGLSHGYMRMRVVALEPSEFEAWQDAQLDGAEMPTDELALEGREIFRTTCSSCHLVEGEGGNEDLFEGSAQVSGAAPNLTHFMSRGTFAGAVFDLWTDIDGNGEVDIDEHGDTLNEAQLKAWLRDPPAEKPMYAPTRGMPNLELSEAQIDALVAYLETLE
ncbi:MAG TPA: cytochrome c oxidase subunit II [Acidimicrobiales bacterium]